MTTMELHMCMLSMRGRRWPSSHDTGCRGRRWPSSHDTERYSIGSKGRLQLIRTSRTGSIVSACSVGALRCLSNGMLVPRAFSSKLPLQLLFALGLLSHASSI